MRTRSYLLFVSVLVLSIMLAGCGATATPTGPAATAVPATGAATKAPAQSTATTAPALPTATKAPAKPTVLRTTIASDPTSLEPGVHADLVAYGICENLHAGLLRNDKDKGVQPYLAEKYEISTDGLSYTFTLRKGLKWQDGSPIVASDIKSGWERHLNPKLAAKAAPGYLDSIVGAKDMVAGKATELSGVQAPDDLTLKVTLATVDAAFLNKLAFSASWTVPASAVVQGEAKWTSKPIGAGPFKLVEWTPGVRVVLEAWDGFFMGRPSLDRVEYNIVPDAASMMAQYEAGQVDWIGAPAADLTRISKDPVLSKELNLFPRAQLLYFGLNLNKVEAFKDKRVRQAFSYAFDRKAIVEKVLFNSVKVATGIIVAGVPGSDPTLKAYEYNPTKAQQLLADAGYPGGKGFPALTVTCYAGSDKDSEAFATQLSQTLGISVKVSVIERAQFLTLAWDHKSLDMFTYGWGAGFLSPEPWLYQLLHSGLTNNFFSYNNPDYDKIVEQARSTVDDAKRAALWQQAEKMAIDDSAILPYAFGQYNVMIKPYVKGLQYRLDIADWLKDVRIEK